MRRLMLCAAALCLIPPAWAANDDLPGVAPLRKRAEVMDRWLELRLDQVVPKIMRREGVDMWLIMAREYNEDPVIETMLPATWMAARRRTILVFFDPGGDAEVARYAVARYDIGRFFKSAWDKEKQPDQWARLVELIAEKNPRKIALNTSRDFGLADGLSFSEHRAFMSALPEDLRDRVVSGERLAIGWLETRIPEEMAMYPQICRIAHALIAEAFSSRVVHPGVTTTADVQWHMRERILDLRLDTWFHPSVSVQRREEPEHSGSFAAKPGETLILPGDLLHVDFGITYLGLNTDTQQHAYVLRPGETAPPKGLVEALRIGNRLQDILTSQFKTGRSGNDILAATRAQAIAEGIKPSIYTHPLGLHGHAAGPTIGLWDQQGGVPGKGDYPLYPDTAYSIELNATVNVPEWNKDIRIMLEEDAFFDGERARYIDGRQTELILIR